LVYFFTFWYVVPRKIWQPRSGEKIERSGNSFFFLLSFASTDFELTWVDLNCTCLLFNLENSFQRLLEFNLRTSSFFPRGTRTFDRIWWENRNFRSNLMGKTRTFDRILSKNNNFWSNLITK
jgi:hypothetical protein